MELLNGLTLNVLVGYFDFTLMVVSLTCLYVSWHNINLRWLLVNILAVELLNLAFSNYFRQSGEAFFIWAVAVDALFIFLLTFRKYTAYIIAIHKRHALGSLFRKAYFRHALTRNELAVIGVYCLAAAVSIVTGLEGQLYTHYIIDSLPIRDNFYQPAMLLIQMMLVVNVIRFTKQLNLSCSHCLSC